MEDVDPLRDLVALLGRLPGVGERTATRLAHFILGENEAYAAQLGHAIASLHERVRRCVRCGNYTTREICRICADPRREEGVLCVVARVPDLVAIERSGSFRGRYHVLHALLAPLDGMRVEDIDVARLLDRIQSESIREVVLATPLSVEGEATALYLAQTLREANVRTSRIASGVPHGGELEYVDQVTLGRALEGRREV